MGKVAKKKLTTNGKPNSRQHRRAASPPLSSVIPTSTPNPKTLPTSQDPLKPQPNGITKSNSNSKRLSRHQRLRREKLISRAETFTDRVVRKIDRSKARGGVRRERRRGWEDVNGDVRGAGVGVEQKKGKGGLDGEWNGEKEEGEGWEDIDVHEEKGGEEGTMDVIGEGKKEEGGDGSSDDEMDEDGGGDEVNRGIRMAHVDAAVVQGLNVLPAAVEEEEL